MGDESRASSSIFIAILLLIFLACAALWLWSGDTVTHMPSGDGTRDLRGADFASGCFDLSGPVAYIPNAHLTPEEFEARLDGVLTGGFADSAPYSTGRLRVYVPAGTYGLMMWNAEFAANIFINGQPVERVGVPSGDAARSVPGLRLLYYTVYAPDGVIEILQQASNHVTPEQRGRADIVIGTPEAVREMYAKQNIIAAVVMGCFLALFLAHLVIYSLLRFYKANLWFSLFCLTWLLNVGYSHPWILSLLAPLSWAATYRLIYLTYPAGLLLLCLIFNELFPGVLQKWFRNALAAVCAAFACVCLFAHTLFAAVLCFYAVIFLAFVYLLARLCVKLRKPSVEQAAILVGMGVFMAGALWDILLLDVVPAFLPAQPMLSWRTTAEYTLLVFVFFQMAVMFRATMREITAARKKEQALLMENALLARETKVREDMVRDLSHEVRTPLTVISTYTQLAVRQFRQGLIDGPLIDGLEAVNAEALRIAELTSKALSPKEYDEKTVDLGEIARQLARLYTPVVSAAARTLTVTVTKKLPASCGAGEITQIIWNLLDNAVKHGDGNIEVDGNMNDEHVYVIVTDYGAGIPPEIQSRILERGVSGGGGSGLGLAIADEIARKYGGRIIIESERGMGTAATLMLPVYREKEGGAHGG